MKRRAERDWIRGRTSDRRGRGRPAHRRIAVAVLVAALGPGFLACSGDGLRGVRRMTYPLDFDYLTQREIQTTMGGLAAEIVALEDVMREGPGPTVADRDAVAAILSRMAALAARLEKGHTSNHPDIDRDIPRLQHDIARALDAVRVAPVPNYYFAGRVAGACTYCHARRHASPDQGVE